MSYHGLRDSESLRKLVIRDILLPLAGGSVRRSIAAGTVVDFDPQLIWLVDAGIATLESRGRGILTVEKEDILGPWFGSVASLSLSTSDGESCELVGFSWSVIEQALSADQRKFQKRFMVLTNIAESWNRVVLH